jgi:hypothetical protein
MIKGIEMNPNNLEKHVTVLADPSGAPTQAAQAVAASGLTTPDTPLVPAAHLVHPAPAPSVSIPSLDQEPSLQAAGAPLLPAVHVTVLAEPAAAPAQVTQAAVASGLTTFATPLVPAAHWVHPAPLPSVSLPVADQVPFGHAFLHITLLAEPAAAPRQATQAVAASGVTTFATPFVPAAHWVHPVPAPSVSLPDADQVPLAHAAVVAFTTDYYKINEIIKIKIKFLFIFFIIIFFYYLFLIYIIWLIFYLKSI